ncbi:GvpL/GvpF family gas vesicle protein [Streptomyces sp. NPDC057445]|uniref:GvpL/GvpF family gas vesicle protein n=1 Tax=Streptomyces sp. NPDC057445 TaxID=3346136 RepID=UPI0036C61297
MTELRYVYAVTRPFDGFLPEDVRGVGGAPVRNVDHGGLVAVVSEVPEDEFADAPLRARLEDLDWLAATARGHEAVVGALTAVTSPLPLRLVTVCRDDSGVKRLIDSGRERFTRALERLDGRVEWGVKVYAQGSRETSATAEPEAPATGRDYLRQRLRRRDAQENTWSQADSVSRRIHTELSRRAEAGLLHRPQDARLPGVPHGNVLNAAYLVPREHSEAFVEEVRRLTPGEPGVHVELTGPWAPYSFVGEGDQA